MIFLFVSFAFSKITLSLNDERKFINWMRTYNNYYTSDEYHFRLGIFLTNLRYIQTFNRQKGITFRLGMNKFSCTTPSEYDTLLGTSIRFGRRQISQKAIQRNTEIPDSIDWRDTGFVLPVKNQGNCGSCWSFAAIATSETAYGITAKKAVSFSEQNLIDCCTECSGCSGGWPVTAVEFILHKQNGRFNSEGDYPYKAVKGYCNYDSSKAVGMITNYVSVNEADEIDLKEKVAMYGVAAVCISAGNSPFMSYSGGILDDFDCNEYAINHAVAVVGYGVEDAVDYWIIKNSWGCDWGEDGYVRLIRNKRNQCGIASQAIIAID